MNRGFIRAARALGISKSELVRALILQALRDERVARAALTLLGLVLRDLSIRGSFSRRLRTKRPSRRADYEIPNPSRGRRTRSRAVATCGGQKNSRLRRA